ncbi:stromal interaction molecule homolog isoform X1 [Cimex lectularius]|uniref:SAM domain-containing protein n=1 Tax=Cimex lectularius TaxID=79782 RepID=A0A8I6S431_CIMLE|nr:stromal interaction molecule homolog isoform X1 [Cimex lectularius]
MRLFQIALLALGVFTTDSQQLTKDRKEANTQNFRESANSNLPASSRSLTRSYSVLDGVHNQSPPKISSGPGEYCYDDLSCSMISPNDRVGLEAIRSLHRQLDDDANGAVDLSESDDFLREELQYESGSERRQKAFHRNDDMHISVKELWEAWVKSEVHNWTVEQTVEWLSVGVGLPQYAQTFISNTVNGATLPRLAVSNMQYLSNVLGIKDPIHKQKIALKAMDVVLFGPPKEATSYIKDIIMVNLLLGALFGFWYAYRMSKHSNMNLKRMMKDMESLHNAEMALENLQKQLERARQEQECATTEKQFLEQKLLEQRGDNLELKTSYSDLEVAELKAENERLRSELQRAEGELEDKCWSPPSGLQQWLQLSHEIENKAYIKKRLSAEKQLQSARDACEKLRKKRSSLVGAFVSTHGKSIDEVDKSIVEARTLLNEVTQELAERVGRWKKIENLCGFNIINNRGLAVLEAELYKGSNGRGFSMKSRMSSQDDLDEDNGIFSSSDRLAFESGATGADSSGSEKLEGDDDSICPSNLESSVVDFAVGGGDFGDEIFSRSRKSSTLSHRDKFSAHSYSQEFQNEHEAPLQVKSSQSDTNLESPVMPVIQTRQKRLGSQKVDLHSSSGMPLEEECYSTDSNSTAAEDISSSEKHFKKSKLRFPKFTRKSRHTPPPEKHT